MKDLVYSAWAGKINIYGNIYCPTCSSGSFPSSPPGSAIVLVLAVPTSTSSTQIRTAPPCKAKSRSSRKRCNVECRAVTRCSSVWQSF